MDDLMSLAAALNVLPITLLLPEWPGDFQATENDNADVTAFGNQPVGALWLWALAWTDLRTDRIDSVFWREVLPPAVAEAFELKKQNEQSRKDFGTELEKTVGTYKSVVSGYEKMIEDQLKTNEDLRLQLENMTALYEHMGAAFAAQNAQHERDHDAKG